MKEKSIVAPATASDKLLATFGLFTLEEPSWSVDEAAERLGLAISTTYRYFRSLSEFGLISVFTTGRYVLGPAIVQLDRQARLLDPLLKAAQPVMQRVAQELEVPGVLLLCRLFRNQIMCIHQEFIDRPASIVSYERGRLMPLYKGAASKAILAYMPARAVRSFHNAHRSEMAAAGFGIEWNDVKANLRHLRSTKVCITVGELDIGMRGFGVPLHTPSGVVDASLGFVLPDSSTNSELLVRISTALYNAANEIDTALSLISDEALATNKLLSHTVVKPCNGVV